MSSPPPIPPAGSRQGELGFLVMIAGGPAGFRIPLRNPRSILGRSPASTIRVPDPSISRSHCSLVFNGTHWVVADLGSSNGTYVDEHEVTQPVLAMPGSILGMGNVQFRIEYALPEQSTQPEAPLEVEAQLVDENFADGELVIDLADDPSGTEALLVDPEMSSELELELELDSLPDGGLEELEGDSNKTLGPDGR
ncbi:MAG: FHA domain-containing protein [Planctomycetes bacterium]|nr:FHA domain-containing protein [Planctomycetota bacterium]